MTRPILGPAAARAWSIRLALAAACSLALAPVAATATDPLPSWNEGSARTRLVEFVRSVTDERSGDYVAPDDRIAVFDNDGTLWIEQPIYVQLAFALDRVKELAPQHPEWKDQEPFASLLKGDTRAALAGGEEALVEILMSTHAGTTSEEFDALVRAWFATAQHPKTGRPYTEMTYQPMLEVLAYLRANGFRTYIVSGGGVEFIRAISVQAYGIPPEQVIGSTIKMTYEPRDGHPALVRLPQIDFIDDKAGKPIAIQRVIGRRPIAAFGNSDGDFEMLEWTTTGEGARLGMLVHHTDAEREFAYDRQSHIGTLDKGLDAAGRLGWTLIDMKRDWKRIYPAQGEP